MKVISSAFFVLKTLFSFVFGHSRVQLRIAGARET
jgi:hypothetical protein